VWGLEISHYAIEKLPPRGAWPHFSARHGAQGCRSPAQRRRRRWCINAIHNLPHDACVEAVQEIRTRCARTRLYPGRCLIATTTNATLFLIGVLTAETFGKPDMWYRLFERAGYTGDYYWTILEVDPNGRCGASSPTKKYHQESGR